MATPLAELLPSLYRALQDTDRSDPIYSDDDLKGLLKEAIAIVEGIWTQGYTVVNDEITPSPSAAMCMVFVLKAALMQRTYEIRYSYNTPILKVTRTSKKEDIDALNAMFKELVDEMRWTAGLSRNEWDDYSERVEQIIQAVSSLGIPHAI